MPLRVSLLGLLLTSTLATSTVAADPARPNIVLFVIDDLGWADLGCCGSTFYRTPNLDRLAAGGRRFTNGYAACPVCSPTRASIMTGQYPARLHLTDWLPGRTDRPSQRLLRPQFRQELPLEAVTIPEALKPAGYVSASIGKWHLGGPGFLPQDQGFDVNIGGTHAGSPPGGYFKFKTPTLSVRTDRNEYLTDRLAEEAEKFLEQNQNRPFFLYLPHYAVHIPLQPKPELAAAYRDRTRGAGTQDNPVYAAMVQSMDEAVGRVVRKLEALKLADRTVVIFTSDNGGLSVKEGPDTPATSNAPLRAGKGYLYEGGIRVPWIVSWPGAIAPGTSDVPVISVDLFPTLLELAGVERPRGRPIDGVSLVPLLKRTGDIGREALYWHYPHYANQGGPPGAAIRLGDDKLIEFYENGRAELYNLKNDPGERTDIAAGHPETVAALRAKLAAWRTSVDAQMPTPNPNFAGARP